MVGSVLIESLSPEHRQQPCGHFCKNGQGREEVGVGVLADVDESGFASREQGYIAAHVYPGQFLEPQVVLLAQHVAAEQYRPGWREHLVDKSSSQQPRLPQHPLRPLPQALSRLERGQVASRRHHGHHQLRRLAVQSTSVRHFRRGLYETTLHPRLRLALTRTLQVTDLLNFDIDRLEHGGLGVLLALTHVTQRTPDAVELVINLQIDGQAAAHDG